MPYTRTWKVIQVFTCHLNRGTYSASCKQNWAPRALPRLNCWPRWWYGTACVYQTFLGGTGSILTYHYNIPRQQDHYYIGINGENSSSKRMCKLNVFVTDKIKKDNVKVAFCPMNDMIGNFITKPIQRSFLYKWVRSNTICPSAQVLMCTRVCYRIVKIMRRK